LYSEASLASTCSWAFSWSSFFLCSSHQPNPLVETSCVRKAAIAPALSRDTVQFLVPATSNKRRRGIRYVRYLLSLRMGLNLAILCLVLFKFLGGFVGSGTCDDVVGQVALMFTVFLVLVLEKQVTIVSPPSDGTRKRSGVAEDARYRGCSSGWIRDRTKTCLSSKRQR